MDQKISKVSTKVAISKSNLNQPNKTLKRIQRRNPLKMIPAMMMKILDQTKKMRRNQEKMILEISIWMLRMHMIWTLTQMKSIVMSNQMIPNKL
jgi:hypothetical protein